MQLHTPQPLDLIHGLPDDAEIKRAPLFPALMEVWLRSLAAIKAHSVRLPETPLEGLNDHMLRDIGLEPAQVIPPVPAWRLLYRHM